MYIGGKQVRPDGNYTRPVHGPHSELVARSATAIARISATLSKPPTLPIPLNLVGDASRLNRSQILYSSPRTSPHGLLSSPPDP